jgi:hypothetical protein
VWRKIAHVRGQRVPGTKNHFWAIWGRVIPPGARSTLQGYAFYITVDWRNHVSGYPVWREGHMLHIGPGQLRRSGKGLCPPAATAAYAYSYRRTSEPQPIFGSALSTTEFLTLTPRTEPCEWRRSALEGVFAGLD